MRVSTFWRNTLCFFLSLTVCLVYGLGSFSPAQAQFAPIHLGQQKLVSTDLFKFPVYNNSYPGVTDGDAFNIQWGQGKGFPYGVAIYLVILGEADSSKPSGRDNDYVPRPDERIAFDRRPQGIFSFPNQVAADRLAAASVQGETKKKLKVGVYVLPILSDSTVCTRVNCDPNQFATVLAQGGGELLISIPSEGRNPIAKLVVKSLFGTDLGKFVNSILGVGDAEKCVGYSADGYPADSPNIAYRGLSCASVIPVGAIFKVPGRVLKVSEVVIQDGTRIQRLLEVSEDVARLSGKFRTAEEVADFAVNANKAATLAWLKEGAVGTKVYYGYSRETGDIIYVGITKQELLARQAQHDAKGRIFDIDKMHNLPDNLTYNQARAIEQWYIDRHGKESLEGVLENINNSVRPDREIAKGANEFAEAFVKNFNLPQP